MDASKKRILILEDDADMLFILKKVLSDSGFHVQSSHSASWLVNGEFELPDLFLIDKDLPTMNGLDVCKYLKVSSITRNIPIIMISYYHVPIKAKRIGVEEFLPKPFELNSLLYAIERQLGSKSKENRLEFTNHKKWLQV